MWDLSSLTRDRTRAPYIGGEFLVPDHQGSPKDFFSIPSLNIFYHGRVLDFVKCFFCINRDVHMVFLLHSINVVYYIDRSSLLTHLG